MAGGAGARLVGLVKQVLGASPGTTIGTVDQGAAGDEAWPVKVEGSATESVQDQMLLELKRIRRLLEILADTEVGEWDGR